MWHLCLTIDPTECQPSLYAPMRQASSGERVEFDWDNQGHLAVMRCAGRVWHLPPSWMQRLDDLERKQGFLDNALKDARSRWGEHDAMGPLLGLPSWKELIHEMAVARAKLSEDQVQWWVQARRLWLALPGMRSFHILKRSREYVSALGSRLGTAAREPCPRGHRPL